MCVLSSKWNVYFNIYKGDVFKIIGFLVIHTVPRREKFALFEKGSQIWATFVISK